MKIKLVESWKHTVDPDLSREFRKAINAGDLEGTKEAALKLLGYLEREVELDEFLLDDLDTLRDEFTNLDSTNNEEDFDYLLDELYDLCDNAGVWIEITEGLTESLKLNESHELFEYDTYEEAKKEYDGAMHALKTVDRSYLHFDYVQMYRQGNKWIVDYHS